MSASTDVPPFLAAWLEAQQALARLAAASGTADPASSSTQQLFASHYLRLFAVPGPAPAAATPAVASAAWQRYQQAAERFGRLLTEAAADAARRFGEALAQSSPDVPSITTWRELHALWIDCGEAAWSLVAHREDFAAAQAELLAAQVALRAAGRAS